MSFDAVVVKVLIASPSDTVGERRAIPEVLHAWNVVHSERQRVVLLPVMWETHSAPAMGERPQAIINRQVVATCDILVGTFWTRVGTHTGISESGTVEEIEEFRKAGKPVMLYFSEAPVVPASIDAEQYRRLVDFKKSCMSDGLVSTYESVDALREKLSRQLSVVIEQMGFASNGSKAITTAPSVDEALELFETIRAGLDRLSADWTSERESQPANVDGGKEILRDLSDLFLDHSGRLKRLGEIGLDRAVGNVIRASKELQGARLMLDGGESYRTFWAHGSAVFDQAGSVIQSLSRRTGKGSSGPDLRIKVLRLKRVSSGLPSEKVISVRAENHGDRPVYLGGGVSFEVDNDDRFRWCGKDIDNRWLTKTVVAPGDAHVISLPFESLVAEGPHIKRFFFTDEIGNVFESELADVRKVFGQGDESAKS